MTTGTVFPAFLQLRHQPDGSARASFLAEVDRTLQPAERRFEEFSSEAKRQLDQALSTKRNASGSLDLGVTEIKAAAQAQQARAIAARELATATAMAAKEEGAYGQSTRLSVAATEAAAREEEQAARAALSHAAAVEQVQTQLNRQASATSAVYGPSKRFSAANDVLTGSTRRTTQAMTMANQQLVDIGIQMQMGQRASIALGQQIPQLGFAFAGLADSSNATTARIGRFATYLSGPLGLAIGMGVGALIDLALGMDEAGKAADDATASSFNFADGLDVLSLSADRAKTAMRQLADETRAAIATQGDLLRSKALIADQSASSLSGRIAQNSEWLRAFEKANDGIGANVLPSLFGPSGWEQGKAKRVREQLAADRAALRLAQEAQTNSEIALAQQRVIESRDPNAKARGEFERRAGELEQARRLSREDPVGATAQGIFISQEQYEAEYSRITGLRDAALEAEKARKRSGRKSTSGRSAEREAARLAEFAEDAGAKVDRIRDGFSDLPSEVERSNRAVAALDDVISDLQRRKPPGFEATIAEAQELKKIIPEIGLDQAVSGMRKESERQLEIDRLILAGREAEAEVLQRMAALEDRFGDRASERLAEVRAIVKARREEQEAIDRALESQQAFLTATQSLKSAVTSLLSGEGADFRQVGKRLQAELTTERLFGDAFRSLEKDIKGAYASGVDRLGQQADATASDVADLGRAAAQAVQDIQTGATGAFTQPTGTGSTGWSAANDNHLIVVQGSREDAKRAIEASDSVLGLTPQQYFDLVGRRMVEPLLAGFEGAINGQLLKGLEGILGGAAGGYVGYGPVGAVLGGLRGAAFEYGPDLWGKKLNDQVLGKFDKAFGGLQTGSMVAGLGKALGFDLSNTGSQVGGAIGAVLPIPGGDIIGSIAGGLLGSLFKKKPYGTAVVNSLDGLRISGNKGDAREGAGSLGGSVQDALSNILNSLGASAGAFNVSIGTYKDNFRVSTRGSGGKLGGYSGSAAENERKYGLYDFDSAEEAIAFAVKTAIEQGAIKGLRASEQNLLRASSDVQATVQDVLDFRSVFDRLKAIKDPVGAALDDLDAEFTRLEDLFDKANASAEERAQLAELYELQRASAVEEAMSRVGGSLQDLLKDLTTGDSGLSLRDRRTNALADYEALQTRVQAGDSTAFDAYAEAARTLLEIERELYGSQGGYFNRYNEVTGTSTDALDTQRAIAKASANRDSPFDSSGNASGNNNQPVVDSIDRLGDRIVNDLGNALGGRLDSIKSAITDLNLRTGQQLSGGRPFDLLKQVGNF